MNNAKHKTKHLNYFQNYRYLDLLNVLCVCDGVAIPDNQTYIAEKWLKAGKVGMASSQQAIPDNQTYIAEKWLKASKVGMANSQQAIPDNQTYIAEKC